MPETTDPLANLLHDIWEEWAGLDDRPEDLDAFLAARLRAAGVTLTQPQPEDGLREALTDISNMLPGSVPLPMTEEEYLRSMLMACVRIARTALAGDEPYPVAALRSTPAAPLPDAGLAAAPLDVEAGPPIFADPARMAMAAALWTAKIDCDYGEDVDRLVDTLEGMGLTITPRAGRPCAYCGSVGSPTWPGKEDDRE